MKLLQLICKHSMIKIKTLENEEKEADINIKQINGQLKDFAKVIKEQEQLSQVIRIHLLIRALMYGRLPLGIQ